MIICKWNVPLRERFSGMRFRKVFVASIRNRHEDMTSNLILFSMRQQKCQVRKLTIDMQICKGIDGSHYDMTKFKITSSTRKRL